DQLNLVSKSARMTFRTVLKEEVAEAVSAAAWMTRDYPKPPGDEAAAPEGEDAAPEGEEATDPEAAATPADEETASDAETPAEGEAPAEGEETASDAETPAEGDEDYELDLTGGSTEETAEPEAEATSTEPPEVTPFTDYDARMTAATDDALITEDITTRFDNIDCASWSSAGPSNSDEVLVTCSENLGTATEPAYQKYILGPVMVDGESITQANSGLRSTSSGQVTNEWIVTLALNKSGPIETNGADQFSKVTEAIQSLTEPKNQFAIVLDDRVVSAPRVNEVIPSGQAEISGSFTQASAKTLADQLSFGSLPMSFDVVSNDQVSATLGEDQLQKGLIAGLIGLILVAIYSFLQYRALSFVTILSLVFATGITYGALLLLSWQIGYRLSLAGVAGIIVSIGITADSFIVYFERIRDELRDGRPLTQAVNQAWVRARRTIIASDAVNFIAAIVLYLVSVGGVRGFAFTLGLTTVMDLLVVIFFTHPIILLLSKTKFWGGGHPWSGLDPHRLGAPGAVHYAGRGRVVTVPGKPARSAAGAASSSSTATAVLERDAAKPGLPAGKPGQSIAERKAAARAASAADTGEDL
ncbi:MAG: protein translocase subunit SecD, partial [Bifidobacteriaceae bacterium]|nr:protein translocase subunit SecD [Bifidobacteriaceae bacterium]